MALPSRPGTPALPDAAWFGPLAERQGPASADRQLPADALRELTDHGSTTIEAVVVVGDLRMSTLVLKEAIQPAVFARFIAGFTEAVRGLVNASDGWFDKFTGDGFIGFWIQPPGEGVRSARIAGFCETALSAAEVLLANLRRNSRNFPARTGLSLGLDAGPCELVRVGDSLTIVGSPIVGATRMVSGAAAGQTLVNIYLGSALERAAEELASTGARLERTVVPTKEYPDGQEAFQLIFVESPSARLDPVAAKGG